MWQVVRRLWTFLSEQLDSAVVSDAAAGRHLILGVLKPVPTQVAESPFLNRDGTTPLFAGFPLCQWRTLASWARAALAAPLKVPRYRTSTQSCAHRYFKSLIAVNRTIIFLAISDLRKIAM